MPDSVKIIAPPHDPLESKLNSANDRLVLSDWAPPRWGIAPHIRFGRHWFNLLKQC